MRQVFQGAGYQRQICNPVDVQPGIGVDGVESSNIDAILVLLPHPRYFGCEAAATQQGCR